MYRHHRVGVVIPAYNEAGFVGAVIDAVPAFVDRVYVVDDASTDGTWAEIRRHARLANDRDGPSVVTVRHGRNRGAGGAVKTGYLRGLADDLDVVATVDSDGQQDPADIDALLDPIVEDRAEYAKGNRLLARHRGEMPRLRFVGNVLLGMLTKIASGYWEIGDPQTGFTAISRRALEAIDVRGLYEDYGYPNDVLVNLNVAGMRVIDVPVPNHYGEEESHIRYRSYVPRVSWLLLRDFLWRLRTKYVVYGFHPLVVAYAVGTLAVLAGIAGGLVLLGDGTTTGDRPGAVVAWGVSLLLAILGVLSWAWAMALDREANAALVGSRAEAADADRREESRRGSPAATARPVDRPVVDGGHQEPAADGGER